MRPVVDALLGFEGRGACTDAERRASLWLHDELRRRGHDVFVETRWVRPQRFATLALGCLLAVAGSLASTASPSVGLGVAAAGALALLAWTAGLPLPFLVRRATQHVLTATPDRTPLVVAAAYDAPSRGLVLNDRWRARRPPRATLAVCGVAIAAAAGARLAGVEGTWLGVAQLVPTVVLLVALAAALDVALSGPSPGANDNASGVAVALALFDKLSREPPRALAPLLLLVGAGHAVPRAVARERLGGVLLEVGPCGAGRPALRSRGADAATARAAGAVAAAVAGPRPSARGVRVGCLDERGIAPRAHQQDDTVVDDAAMAAALDLALAVVDAIDSELAVGRA